jgi:hypothetical protein
MAKRRPPQIKPKRTPLIRWGTQKQGKANERERGYLNRIHELETMVNTLVDDANKLVHDTTMARGRLQSALDAIINPVEIIALRCVCSMPLVKATELGLAANVTALCKVLARLEDTQVQAKAKAAIVQDALDKVASGKPLSVPGTNPNPVFPAVSGVTKVRPDEDDADSVDDLFAKGVDVHLERMDDRYYWLGLTPIGGETVHIDISQTKSHPMRARIRK